MNQILLSVAVAVFVAAATNARRTRAAAPTPDEGDIIGELRTADCVTKTHSGKYKSDLAP
jgi:hypothetical protein